MLSLCATEKHQKTFDFVIFSGWYRNRSVVWNVLKILHQCANCCVEFVQSWKQMLTTEAIKRCELCSKLTLKTTEQRQWGCSDVFNVNFEHISHVFTEYSYLWPHTAQISV